MDPVFAWTGWLNRGGAAMVKYYLAWLLVMTMSCAIEPFPDQLVHFIEHPANPLFVAGEEGTWDERIRERGFIFRSDKEWRLYYGGYRKDERKTKLGFATSQDGIAWQRSSQEPILANDWVEDMMVVEHEGTYYMVAEGPNDQAHMLTSIDGLKWIPQGKLNVHLHSGQPISPAPFGTPTLLHTQDAWYLFYERFDDGIWVAKSDDLITFTNISDMPVLPVGPWEYDELQVALNQVIEHDGWYYAYYNGLGRRDGWTINVARSQNLVHWHKWAGNPLLPRRLGRTSGYVIHDGQKYRLYTAAGRLDAYLNF